MTHPAPAHRSLADCNSLYQQISDKIIAELEQGRVPCPWPAATCAYRPSANQMRTAACGLAEPKSLRILRWSKGDSNHRSRVRSIRHL
jgi:hypothetical protein